MTRLALFLLALLTTVASSQPLKKKLVVVVVIDQMRQDQLQRHRAHFLPATEGGFLRLAEQGIEHQRAFHDHHPLHTATGHSSLATGALPSVHGVVGNRWPHQQGAGPTDAGVDPEFAIVGADNSKAEGVSPRDLLAPTLGDTFKRASDGRARVVTVAHKDRTAVLLGGRSSDACLWLDEATGNWVTSRFYAPDGQLPPFVDSWNRSRHPNQDFGKIWRPALTPPNAIPAPTAAELRGVAGDYVGLGSSFPHTIDGGQEKPLPHPQYYVAWSHTPWAQHAGVDLALESVDFYQMGQDEVPDLLYVGLGSLDKVGHVFGPDSPESVEMLLETDRALARFLDGLQQRVGLEHCLIALSSDHGVTPLVEHLNRHGTASQRLPLPEFKNRLERRLSQRWTAQDYTLHLADPHLFLNVAPSKQADRPAMLAALKDELSNIVGVKAVLERDQLLRGQHRGTSWETIMARSVFPSRSGDLVMVFDPNHILGFTRPGGTTHGNPWTDDTHVPLLMLGFPQDGRVEKRTCAPRQLVSTICLALGLTPPGGCDAEPLPWAVER